MLNLLDSYLHCKEARDKSYEKQQKIGDNRMVVTYSDWIKYGKSFRDFKDKTEDYCGYLVRVKGNDSDILIGDCSQVGGGCDCCSIIDYDDVIEKYRKIISKEEQKTIPKTDIPQET
jgi:hypothetical protein